MGLLRPSAKNWQVLSRGWLVVPAGVWIAGAAAIIVLIWGMSDPFGLRRRLDWLVSDQFLRARRAPPVHSDLVQIAIDDWSRDHVGFPLPRYKLARVLRQLKSLGARTVMIDILFSEAGSENPALDEAQRQLVPSQSVVQDDLQIRDRFLEDNLLAAALGELDRVVIAFHLTESETGSSEETILLAAMAGRLVQQPSLKPDELAGELNAPGELVRRLFDRAVAAAVSRIADQAIRKRPGLAVSEYLAEYLPAATRDIYLLAAFETALDRAEADRVIVEKASVNVLDTPLPGGLLASSPPQMPRAAFAQAATTLGFMDAQLDSDGTLRRLPLVARHGDRLYLHEGLAAVLLHLGAELNLNVRSGNLAIGDKLEIPVDSGGQLVINWPTAGSGPRSESIPQVPFADLYKLDSYETDLKWARHELRRCAAGIDQNAADGGIGLAVQFTEIESAYRVARRDDADRLERDFDAGVTELLALNDVRRAMDQVVPGDSAQADQTAPPLHRWCRAYRQLNGEIQSLEQEYNTARVAVRSRIESKLCLIGDMTTASVDLKRTPVAASVPGITVIASAANTILTERYLAFSGFAGSAVMMLIASAILTVISLRLNAVAAGAFAIATVITMLLGSFALIDLASLFVSPVTPVVGLIATYATITTYRWWDEFQQKKLVRTIFETQTNPTIVERLIEAGTAGVEEVLAPRNRQVTVLFAQIADYNQLVERMDPDQVAGFLSRVFGTMAKLVLSEDGTLDRYEGHAMMAFFGAPMYQPDHAERACRAALGCRQAVHDLATANANADLRVHFGIHTGELLVGNITLTSRVDYTVAGDNLSVAYRIADLNETYGTEIMITKDTADRCAEKVDVRELDTVRIKGRREPVRAFELISLRGEGSRERMTLLGSFVTGLTAFRNRDYAAALSMFRACQSDSPTDRATSIYIARCERELSPRTAEGQGGDRTATE